MRAAQFESFHALTSRRCLSPAWSYPSIVPSEEDRAKIDQWVAEAPETRVVETTRTGSRWTTHAIDDGDIVYEETDFGDEPLLHLIAA